MSDKITASQIYLFLAKQDDWVKAADLDGDQEISKGEMRTYLNSDKFSEFTHGVTIKDVSAKTFDEFWEKLDNNAINNKLDSTELAGVEERITNYQKLESIINEYAPNGIVKPEHMSLWSGKMADELLNIVDNYNSSCGQSLEELLNAAIPAAFNKATAEVLATQYTSSAAIKSLISGAGINYDIQNDKTLNTIVNNYIQSELLKVGDNDSVTMLGAADIEKQIKDLVNSYLATAGIGDGGSIDVSKYGYDKNVLNDAQNAVVLAKISNSLASEKSKFPGYEDKFDSVLNSFIQNYLKSTDITAQNGKSLFETILANLDKIKSDFTKSKEYKNLQNTIEVFKRFRDDIKDDFKNAVKTALGDERADLLIKAGLFKDSKYEEILNNIISRINSDDEKLMTNGQPDWTKIQDAVIEGIKTKYGNVSNGSANKLDELQTDYENNMDDLEKAKEKAIAYCDEVANKGKTNSEYLEALKTAFGTTDYKTIINAQTSTIDLADKMNVLFAEVAKIVVKEKETEANKVLAENIEKLKETLDDIKYEDINSIINGKAEMHTEFGINKNGNIVFQENDTTTIYNSLVNKILSKLRSTEAGKAILESISEADIKKLIQAAWITTYNNYNSSKSNNTVGFVTTTIDNFGKILESIAKNPQYLKIYTQHTAYANSSITNGVTHYGTSTTHGGDERIITKSGYYLDDTGVHLNNKKDDPDYIAAMDSLLSHLYKAYDLDKNLIKDIFRKAQLEALYVENSNLYDCPYGTGKNKSRVEDDDNNRYWGGKDNRKDDDYKIDMDELIQLTLYFFDKLLYAELMK